MPPKKQPQGAAKKTEQKKQEKVIEDKTFGLKNKKGNKQQKFIKHVTHQVKHQGQSQQKLEADKYEAQKKKQVDVLEDVNKLLKPVAAMPKVDKSVDPKSILCVFYKQGSCQKGSKCKFSHDMSLEFKAEKRNVYADARDEENMDDWDEETLNDVVTKKHGEKDKLKPKTAIVCKYFLDALENSKYGWFWECPNGDACIYRHALPPGYVLKKDRKKLEEADKLLDKLTIEDVVEKERAALGSNTTKVTLESFLKWKQRKLKEKKDKAAKESRKKENEYKSGREGGLSGRELFTFDPSLVGQDDEEADETHYTAQEDQDSSQNQEEERVMELTLDSFRTPVEQESSEADEILQNGISSEPGSSEMLKEKKDKAAKESRKKENEYKSGREGGLSGRELFTFDPSLVGQDDEEADETHYTAQEDQDSSQNQEEERVMELTLDSFRTPVEQESSEADEILQNGISSEPGSSEMVINEDLFADDADIPSSDDDSDDDRGD